jgi:uncharacterized protein (TIGR02646 family)
VIPVTEKPEPKDVFDELVRQPGQTWLRENKIALDQPPPDPAKLPTYWRNTQKELWTAYDGVCAYLCIFFEWPLGAHSTDHFIAKSRLAGQAYEWSNYRLSCLGMNRARNRFDDVLDPFEIAADTFVLNLATGDINPNPGLPDDVRQRAEATIERLGLRDDETKKMRASHFQDYLEHHVDQAYLKRRSPFVWYEANRQGLL